LYLRLTNTKPSVFRQALSRLQQLKYLMSLKLHWYVLPV
jgi:hypothetical protein